MPGESNGVFGRVRLAWLALILILTTVACSPGAIDAETRSPTTQVVPQQPSATYYQVESLEQLYRDSDLVLMGEPTDIRP
ncbi:MAG: hypothetical protein GWP04_10480 [Gammaproteobacteria bacterium]|nr:hypothetical protein [Gammaproteobacteria bacterium]